MCIRDRLYLIMYMLMFSAAIVLRYKMKGTARPFRLGKKGNGLMRLQSELRRYFWDLLQLTLSLPFVYAIVARV